MSYVQNLSSISIKPLTRLTAWRQEQLYQLYPGHGYHHLFRPNKLAESWIFLDVRRPFGVRPRLSEPHAWRSLTGISPMISDDGFTLTRGGASFTVRWPSPRKTVLEAWLPSGHGLVAEAANQHGHCPNRTVPMMYSAYPARPAAAALGYSHGAVRSHRRTPQLPTHSDAGSGTAGTPA